MSSWFKTSTKDLSKSIAQLLEGSVGHPIGLSSPDSVTFFYKSFYIPYSYIFEVSLNAHMKLDENKLPHFGFK